MYNTNNEYTDIASLSAVLPVDTRKIKFKLNLFSFATMR